MFQFKSFFYFLINVVVINLLPCTSHQSFAGKNCEIKIGICETCGKKISKKLQNRLESALKNVTLVQLQMASCYGACSKPLNALIEKVLISKIDMQMFVETLESLHTDREKVDFIRDVRRNPKKYQTNREQRLKKIKKDTKKRKKK